MIQQNINRSDVFNRSWAEYKVGFNESTGNYWLGNDLLSQLTMTDRYKLRIDLQSRSTNNWYYAEYSTFIVQPESDNYRLRLSGYSGNVAWDGFSNHDGTMFSTFDRDNDQFKPYNCATYNGGGFWYHACCNCCVNKYNPAWVYLIGGNALQSTRMWLQCK